MIAGIGLTIAGDNGMSDQFSSGAANHTYWA